MAAEKLDATPPTVPPVPVRTWKEILADGAAQALVRGTDKLTIIPILLLIIALVATYRVPETEVKELAMMFLGKWATITGWILFGVTLGIFAWVQFYTVKRFEAAQGETRGRFEALLQKGQLSFDSSLQKGGNTK